MTMGSIFGTLSEAREDGDLNARLIRLRSFRPFPVEALKEACAGLKKLVVLERALSPGGGGILGVEVRAALAEMDQPPVVYNYAVGLGGRDVPLSLLSQVMERVDESPRERFAIFDVEVEKLPEEDR
jgi:pyruvate ferredoxin oxidoreductase alpha subunit